MLDPALRPSNARQTGIARPSKAYGPLPQTQPELHDRLYIQRQLLITHNPGCMTSCIE